MAHLRQSICVSIVKNARRYDWWIGNELVEG